MSEQVTYYQAVGGKETFRRLVQRFYAGVPDDPVLGPLYPEDELEPAAERLQLFLEQYWGGPRTYSELRGHPRLRMRHAPFRIGIAERDAWLARMREALDSLELDPQLERPLWEYLEHAAHFMINTVDEEPGRSLPQAP